jgi:thiaminase (transcriptional activator TenA)
MDLSTRLFDDHLPVARRCLEHPFVQGIADGSLPRDRFVHYVGQDACFLDAFVRAYALALAKAPRAEVDAWKTLLDGGIDELRLHRSYAERWGADLDPPAAPATSAYTDFLLRVAALEPVGHAAAAMAPCMRLYAWLGQSLAPVASPESPYREWVDTYADPEFEGLAAELERLVETSAGDQGMMAGHYGTAMDLEYRFFDAAWPLER